MASPTKQQEAYGDEGNDAKLHIWKLEIWARPQRRTLGLVDHYFLVIGDSEYHLGAYRSSDNVEILPRGSTRNAILVSVRYVCRVCFEQLSASIEHREYTRLFDFYPIVNCESLVRGFSLQSTLLALVALPLVFLVLVLIGSICWALLAFTMVFTLHLAISKYTLSRIRYTNCRHLHKLLGVVSEDTAATMTMTTTATTTTMAAMRKS